MLMRIIFTKLQVFHRMTKYYCKKREDKKFIMSSLICSYSKLRINCREQSYSTSSFIG